MPSKHVHQKQMLSTFSSNNAGRDFICSDIHGHFSLLEAELSLVNFDEGVDRLFSLGDLIDRGEESHLALEWLKKPWFYAIQGNHERMLINAYEQRSEMLWRQWMMWGGDWAEDMGFEQLESYFRAFKSLPIGLEIALTDSKTIGLIHAELPDVCDWREVRDVLLSVPANQVEANRITSDMLWNKAQPYLSSEERGRVKPVANIYHVFHGHTIVEDYLTITNRTFMDLGAYQTGRIGLIEPVQFLNL